MDIFSISQLYQFSGIKPHTIRVWEQRYNALNPDRSKGNTRSYNNSQLRRLLNIVSLMNTGHKISELCLMSDKELYGLVQKQIKDIPDGNEIHQYFISQLISAGMTYDEIYFEKIFSACVNRYEIHETYIKIIYPMLVRLGIMWTSDTLPPAQEHFISNIIRQKLFKSIDLLPVVNSNKKAWLLFLPENEFHETGLLFSNYVIRKAGKKVIYLGSNVPLQTLIDAIDEIHPAHLFFFLVHNNVPENAKKYLKTLRKNFPGTKIHLAGNEKLISKLKTGKEINWVKSVEELEKAL